MLYKGSFYHFWIGMSLILAHILPVYKKQYPSVEIELFEGSSLEIKNMVLDFKANLGISTSPYIGLEHRIFFFISCLCKNDYLLNKNRNCTT